MSSLYRWRIAFLMFFTVLLARAITAQPPQFITRNHVDLDAIEMVSRFRSGAGHDYSHGEDETCRSMKHYFVPYLGLDWSAVSIFSPTTGTIVRMYDEWAGRQVVIQSKCFPDAEVRLFHVNLDPAFDLGVDVVAGQQLGTMVGPQAYSDIAAFHEGHHISCFEAMTDQVFQQFLLRGVPSREEMIITREERDADPLECEGETFLSESSLPDWVTLDEPAPGESEPEGEEPDCEGETMPDAPCACGTIAAAPPGTNAAIAALAAILLTTAVATRRRVPCERRQPTGSGVLV